jgi:hypothetical protein
MFRFRCIANDEKNLEGAGKWYKTLSFGAAPKSTRRHGSRYIKFLLRKEYVSCQSQLAISPHAHELSQ